MTRLILIRHGQSVANLEDRFAGFYDAPLTELGKTQAKLSAEYVAKHYQISAVYASDLKRAFDTGKAVAEKCGVKIFPDTRLREINAGAWEGLEFSEIIEKYAEDFAAWMRDIGSSKATDGESVAELGERFFGALLDIAKKNEGKDIAIATHATPIRTAECLIRHGNLTHMKEIPWVSNASVSVFEYNEGRFEVRLISYDEHLEGRKTKLPVDV